MKKNYAPRSVQKDVQRIEEALSPYLVDISLFGSALTVGFRDAGDIDLAVTVRGMNLTHAKNRLASLRLHLPLRISQANGTYVAADSKAQKIKDYHIVLLDADHPNLTFLTLNQGRLHSMTAGSNSSLHPTSSRADAPASG